jgi:hypothetical protein
MTIKAQTLGALASANGKRINNKAVADMTVQRINPAVRKLNMRQNNPTRQNVTEHGEQCAVIEWVGLQSGKMADVLRFLFAIPNGGMRHPAIAKKLKAEGVKSGVSDLFLAYPAGGYCGLWIEMKVGKNKPTPEQEAWINDMNANGYSAWICYGADEAIEVLTNYVQGATK